MWYVYMTESRANVFYWRYIQPNVNNIVYQRNTNKDNVKNFWPFSYRNIDSGTRRYFCIHIYFHPYSALMLSIMTYFDKNHEFTNGLQKYEKSKKNILKSSYARFADLKR